MRRWCRWFWPAMLWVLLCAAWAGWGYRQLTTNIPLNLAAWRQNAAVNADSGSGVTAKITDVTATRLAQARLQRTRLQKSAGIGVLSVPSEHLRLTIFGHMTDATLSLGVARYYPSRVMGQGNNVYAAHNLAAQNLLLTRTRQLKKGAVITQTDFAQTWRYQVVYNRVVRATEVAVLKQTDEARLTLIRCEGDIGTPYRRVIIARLTGVKPYVPLRSTTTGKLADQALAASFSPWAWAVILLGFAALMAYGWRGYWDVRK